MQIHNKQMAGSTPKHEKCPVAECGAVVLRLQVEGEAITVNPEPGPVFVEDAGRVWRQALGYQPHWMTCVDVEGRMTQGQQRGGKWNKGCL